MSESEAHERPLVVNWGTVGWVLSMLFAGFIAWSSMSERVRLLEEQQKQYATVAQLSETERDLSRQLEKLTDLLCDDPEKAQRRTCVERAP